MNEHNTLLTRQKAFFKEIQLGRSADRRRTANFHSYTPRKLKKKKNLNLKVKRAISSYTQESHYKGHFLCVKTWIIPISKANSAPI